MNTRAIAIPVLTATLLAGCAATPSPERRASLTAEAQAATGQLIQTLGGELKKAIKESGPENAVTVCKEKAVKIAADISAEKGVKVRRVTMKTRNPDNAPDTWETGVLKDFEQRLAGGARPADLEHTEVVRENGQTTFRYMKGLVLQEVCMTCHGTPETIPEGVKARLAVEYPHDKATGYLPNMLRGAVTVQKPL